MEAKQTAFILFKANSIYLLILFFTAERMRPNFIMLRT